MGKYKKFIIPAAAVLALVIVIIIAAIAMVPSKYETLKNSISINSNDEEVVIKQNGKKAVTQEGYLYSSSISLDKTKGAFVTSEEDADGFSLYYFDGTAINVAGEINSYSLSLNGNAIIYSTDVEDEVGALYIYKDGKSTLINSDYYIYGGFAVSPDGSAVGYTTMDDDGDLTGLFYDGKNRELGRGIMPVALTNGGKLIYFEKNDKLYVQKGDNADSKQSLGESVSIVGFNKDMSELIYSASAGGGSKTYISRNGGEKQSLTSNISGILTPHGTNVFYSQGGRSNYSTIYGISSFADTYYYDGSSIYHIDGKYETRRVTSKASSPQLAKDGKTILYLKSDSLQIIDGSKDGAEPVELVSEEVKSFIMTDNATEFYFINTYDELYYQKGAGKPTTVCDDVYASSLYGQSFAHYRGNKVFYISDNELYSSTGGKGTLVKGIDGEISYIYSDGISAVAISYDDGVTTIYSSDNGSDFEKIAEY